MEQSLNHLKLISVTGQDAGCTQQSNVFHSHLHTIELSALEKWWKEICIMVVQQQIGTICIVLPFPCKAKMRNVSSTVVNL